MGIALGLAAALCFAAASLFARVGMRTSPRDDGLFLTIVVNVVLLGSISLFVPRPPWDTEGVMALAAAGLVGHVGGGGAPLDQRGHALVHQVQQPGQMCGDPGYPPSGAVAQERQHPRQST